MDIPPQPNTTIKDDDHIPSSSYNPIVQTVQLSLAEIKNPTSQDENRSSNSTSSETRSVITFRTHRCFCPPYSPGLKMYSHPPPSFTCYTYNGGGGGGNFRRLVMVKNRSPEDDEKIDIPEEEAICRFCFNVFRDCQNVFKTKCKCRLALFHEECAIEWFTKNKGSRRCDVCDQDTHQIPVSLSSMPDFSCSSNTGTRKSRSRDKEMRDGSTHPTNLQRFRRWPFCCFN